MTAVLLSISFESSDNNGILTISSTYSISVVNSKTLKNTRQYYKLRYPEAELIVLKTYKSYNIDYKDDIYEVKIHI